MYGKEIPPIQKGGISFPQKICVFLLLFATIQMLKVKLKAMQNDQYYVEGNSSILSGKMSSWAYYIFITLIVLVPIVFIPSRFLTLDVSKTFIVVLGTLLATILYCLSKIKQNNLQLPPKSISITLLVLAVVSSISSLLSIQAAQSFWGQGFELSTTAFLIVLMLASFTAYKVIIDDPRRVIKIFTIITGIFLLFAIFHIIRIAFGADILTLGILFQKTDTLLGKWPELAIFGALVLIIISSALSYLPLSRKMQIVYSLIGIIALLFNILINKNIIWLSLALVFALITIASFVNNKRSLNNQGFFRNISWLPLAVCIVSIVFAWQGTNIVGKVIVGTGTQYSEIALPWQVTMDIAAQSIKNYPLFGVGPNHFTQAYITYKPVLINQTDFWQVEFNAGFGLIPTYAITQGLLGLLVWVLLLIFVGNIIVKSWKKLPVDAENKFSLIALGACTTLLLVLSILYIPSHTIYFFTFTITLMFIAYAVSSGAIKPLQIDTSTKPWKAVLFRIITIIFVCLCIFAIFTYTKKTIALIYFAKGVNDISVSQSYDLAESAFKKALSFDESDVYWQAISENSRLKAINLIQTATSTSEALGNSVSSVITNGIEAARKAIVYDGSNYYNRVAEGRISELGASLKITNAYENAVKAYTEAIRINPLNPALYLKLAQVQIGNNNLDQALQTLGTALQVKSNYLDAVYLISQIYAAKGNLGDAITAAKVAINLNSKSPLLYFQLGLLEYNAKDYETALQAFIKAVELQPDYANAKYFLGLSAYRVGDIATAIAQFDALQKNNPDNKEIAIILSNLRAGKSPFANTSSTITSNPEKRSSLPVKERK